MYSLPIKAKEGGECTLRFYYHMFGKHVNSLKVYTVSKATKKRTLQFTATGEVGDIWTMAKIDLSKEVDIFQVLFEGRFSFIDHVTISQ